MNNENNYGLNQQINGKDVLEYMADLIERNEKDEISIDRAKISVGILKQLNNRCRLALDVDKFKMKQSQEALNSMFKK